MSYDRSCACKLNYQNPAIDVSDGGDLTYKAFQQIPVIGTPILVIGIAAFAYSTILGWSYYGERCVEYLSAEAV